MVEEIIGAHANVKVRHMGAKGKAYEKILRTDETGAVVLFFKETLNTGVIRVFTFAASGLIYVSFPQNFSKFSNRVSASQMLSAAT